MSREAQVIMYLFVFSFSLAISCMKAPLCHVESLFIMQLKFDLRKEANEKLYFIHSF